MTGSDGSLSDRFRATLADDGVLSEGDAVVVALSGGLDSTVLLHLLRYTPRLPPMSVHAAHFDHRMRAGSEADASWVSGLTNAWSVPLFSGVAGSEFSNEQDARVARYGFLEQVREESGADWVLTAHHADDQAETVLYRALRGSGIAGLAGIPRMREPALYRPLLTFWREELEAYAEGRGLRCRPDPSNTASTVPRNVIRNDILPLAEAQVAPAARRALYRLGTLAAEENRLWDALVPTLLASLDVERAEGAISFARDPFLVYDPIVQTKLLRTLLREQGTALDAAGTRAALEFTRAGASGRALSLPGAVGLSRSFGRIAIARGTERRESRSVTVDAPGDGAASGLLEGRPFTARWSTGGPVGWGGFLCLGASLPDHLPRLAAG